MYWSELQSNSTLSDGDDQIFFVHTEKFFFFLSNFLQNAYVKSLLTLVVNRLSTTGGCSHNCCCFLQSSFAPESITFLNHIQ